MSEKLILTALLSKNIQCIAKFTHFTSISIRYLLQLSTVSCVQCYYGDDFIEISDVFRIALCYQLETLTLYALAALLHSHFCLFRSVDLENAAGLKTTTCFLFSRTCAICDGKSR